jgi:hypothetical protein
MAEDKSGKVKITIEVEVNEALMGIAKECMEAMPEMMKMFKKEKE